MSMYVSAYICSTIYREIYYWIDITTHYITSISVILSKKETPQRKKVFLTSLSSLLLPSYAGSPVVNGFMCVPYRCVQVFTFGELDSCIIGWFFPLMGGFFSFPHENFFGL